MTRLAGDRVGDEVQVEVVADDVGGAAQGCIGIRGARPGVAWADTDDGEAPTSAADIVRVDVAPGAGNGTGRTCRFHLRDDESACWASRSKRGSLCHTGYADRLLD